MFYASSQVRTGRLGGLMLEEVAPELTESKPVTRSCRGPPVATVDSVGSEATSSSLRPPRSRLFHVGELENVENSKNVIKKICSATQQMINYVIIILQISRS